MECSNTNGYKQVRQFFEINLCTIKDIPFKAIEKFKSLNFNLGHEYSDCQDMKIELNNIKDALKKYKNHINITYTEKEEIDLRDLNTAP